MCVGLNRNVCRVNAIVYEKRARPPLLGHRYFPQHSFPSRGAFDRALPFVLVLSYSAIAFGV